MTSPRKILSTFALIALLCSSSLVSAHASDEHMITFEGDPASVKSVKKEVVKKTVVKKKEPVKKVVKKVVKKTPVKKEVKKVIKKVTPATPVVPVTPTPAPAAAAPATHNVTIENFAFGPAELKIKVGDSVTFTQKDSTPHTVDTDPHPTHTQLPGFDSGTLTQGKTYTFTFTKKGTFTYHCSPHPSMMGTIIVE